MDTKYLMEHRIELDRKKNSSNQINRISPIWKHRWLVLAIEQAISFYQHFLSTPPTNIDTEQLANSYEQLEQEAKELRLFQTGGIRRKDHLNLWCLCQVLRPKYYLESGVFKGSSFHAAIRSGSIVEAWGIDPNLTQCRLPKDNLPTLHLIDDKDFSQLTFDGIPGEQTLLYFDDHINAAQRILHAAEKGFRYLLFDDATGLQGITQRLYPAVPTIPMIVHHDTLLPGETLSWSFRPIIPRHEWHKHWKLILQTYLGGTGTRVELKITSELIHQCEAAAQKIKRWTKVPDLGCYITPLRPERMVDTSKYLVELAY